MVSTSFFLVHCVNFLDLVPEGFRTNAPVHRYVFSASVWILFCSLREVCAIVDV